MSLALHLGRTLAELRSTLSAEEYGYWKAYQITHGLPHFRAEWGRAIAGAAICQSHGAKCKPAELVPSLKPTETPITNKEDGAAILLAWANNVNRTAK